MENDPKPAAAHFIPLAWPVVAILAILIFLGPLTRLADGLSYRAQEVVTVKLGELELHYAKSDLPVPSDEVAAALSDGLSEQNILTLLEYDLPEGNPELNGGPCFSEIENDERFSVFKSLAEKNLINFIEKEQKNEWCENPHAVSLTELGDSVKKFLISLISVQID